MDPGAFGSGEAVEVALMEGYDSTDGAVGEEYGETASDVGIVGAMDDGNGLTAGNVGNGSKVVTTLFRLSMMTSHNDIINVSTTGRLSRFLTARGAGVGMSGV